MTAVHEAWPEWRTGSESVVELPLIPAQPDGAVIAGESRSGVVPALRPMVVVSVGTDHHPFDRLVQWIDRWAQHHLNVDVVIQYGSAAPPGHARSVPYLSHTDLVANITAAAVVVSHGGPATIAEAWRAGMIPLVIPRDSGFGEHVDNHQMTFVGVLASRGQVVEIRTETQLGESLDRALEDPSWLHRDSGHAWDVSASLSNIDDVVRRVTNGRAVRRSILRRLIRGAAA